MRWLLAALGWLAPNLLLYLALASIPESTLANRSPAWVDWGAGYTVFGIFFTAFFAAGMASIRLALHGAPEWGRKGLARIGFWFSLAFMLLGLYTIFSEGKTDLAMGVSCLMLWGLGQLLGSRWKARGVAERTDLS